MEVDRETLEHLYIVNKQAKRQTGVEKTILYRLKDEIIVRIAEKRKSVEIHNEPKIDGKSSYCLTFEDNTGESWAFHTSQETLDIPSSEIQETRSLENFQKNGEYEVVGERGSLKEALLYFQREFSVNANDLHPKMPETRRSFRKYLRVESCPDCGLDGTKQEIELHQEQSHN